MMAYYGMMRAGKLVRANGSLSNHAVKASDVHIGVNKPKIVDGTLFVKDPWV